jgi:integrase
MPWSLYNRSGQRKYLTRAETLRFLRAAQSQSAPVRHFCWVLAASGCRISEGLALTARNFDFHAGTLVLACLKKRGKKVFRAIPLPRDLLQSLKKWLASIDAGRDQRLWGWSRMTGYRRVCDVMYDAGITGDFASPKGLRHGFGINAVQSGVPLNLIQRWLGHADLKTTAIYTSAMGAEEREIASRMWHPGRRSQDRTVPTDIRLDEQSAPNRETEQASDVPAAAADLYQRP